MQISQRILMVLEGQRFTDFYNGKFLEYIEGPDGAPTKQEIISQIKKEFGIEGEGDQEKFKE